MSGWKLVPVDPNTPQRRIGQHATGIMDLGHDAYTRMVKAAPSPPDEVLERMARAFLEEYDTYRPGRSEAGRQRDAGRAALAAADGEQASIPTSYGDGA